MSVYVVVQLEIIQIDDHHACPRHINFLDRIFEIPSVMCSRQSILIQLIRIAGQLINKLFTALRIDQGIHIQLLDHFHDIRLMIDLHIFGKHLIQGGIHIFQLYLHFSLHGSFSGNTVVTAFVLLPEAVTFAAVRISLKAVRKQPFHADHTHNIKDLPHRCHIVFHFLHCQIVFHFHFLTCTILFLFIGLLL